MSQLSLNDWSARTEKLNIEGRAFTNGECVDAISGETRDSLNPVRPMGRMVSSQ